MKPIPRNLLIHTVTLVSDIETDCFNAETARQETIIKNVRIEPAKKLDLSKDNYRMKLDAVMYYDVKNSTPYEFTVNHKVIFMSESYNIVLIKKLFDGRRLHHLEIGLSL